MSKSFPKFLPLIPCHSGTPLQGVGKVLADIYARRLRPLIKLPKKYDYQGKASYVQAAQVMSAGQVRDVNGEVWQAVKVGHGYVATH